MTSVFDSLLNKKPDDAFGFDTSGGFGAAPLAPVPTATPTTSGQNPISALVQRLLAVPTTQNNKRLDLGQLLTTLRGGAHYGMSGALIDPATGHDPGNDAVFGGPIKFQSSQERLAEMTNRTGSYAPIDQRLQAATLALIQQSPQNVRHEDPAEVWGAY